MQAVIKLLIVFGELIQRYLDKRGQVERDAKLESIRKDPAVEFLNEFAGVPVKPAEPPSMPGSQAGAKVSSKE